MSTHGRAPSVDRLSRDDALGGYAPRVRVAAARRAVDALRATGSDYDAFRDMAVRLAGAICTQGPRPAIDMAGVVLHTGLGRARLAERAAERIAAVARDHCLLELDTESGERGDRQSHVRDLLRELTGAEDALVVNNGAGAVLLALASLASGRDVILSRGQMIEIGGSFRMPDVVRESGCRLVEVGCTNQTHLHDFESAITPTTGAILRCHPSNFTLSGFVSQPEPRDLAELSRRHGAAFVDDLGSGCLVDTRAFGLPRERTLQDALGDGADVVTASGDKLLGGPQCGLVLGRTAAIAAMRAHPLARALRVDKLAVAGLAATLELYAEGKVSEIPVWRVIAKPLDAVRRRARALARACPWEHVVQLGETEIGGGASPGTSLPTWRLGIAASDACALARRLRQADPSVVGRIEDGLVWLDPRCADEREVREVARLLARLGADE